MQFNSGNNGSRRDNRSDSRRKSSDSRSYDKKRDFRQSKSRSFDDEEENGGRPRRTNRFGNNRPNETRGSKPSYRSQPRRSSDGDESNQKAWTGRKTQYQRPQNTDGQYRKPYQRRNSKTDSSASSFGEDKGVRLNRYIANAGVCSRRDAEQYITAGVISINGKIVTELATKVYYGDVVKFNGAPLMPERKTYILLNKPKDYVTTTDDPHAEKTVMDLIDNASKNRVYPVGRLDRATTGLLLLTNDGDLAEHLCHPKYNKQKIYQVTLDRKVTPEDIEKMLTGIELEDGPANADEVEYCNPEDPCEVGVAIHSGRNRIVRRMFEALKYKVKKLDRVYYAGLTKKNLPRGKWRFLTDKEVAMLKRGAYK
jgi:23S rRNA pseudouridine2605 synthase